MTDTKFMRSKNGNAGQTNLNASDARNDPIAAANAPFGVVRFQNIPSKKITTIPGVKNPVYS